MNVSEMQSQTVTTEYNGWSNRETWIVNLWMTGDQVYYEQLCEIISSHDSLDDQAEALEDWIRFEYDGEYSSMWADIRIVTRKAAEHLKKKGVRNSEFPYKRIVMCTECPMSLYGSSSNDRHGSYYPAYRSRYYFCKCDHCVYLFAKASHKRRHDIVLIQGLISLHRMRFSW